MTDWAREREMKKLNRLQDKIDRAMSAPAAVGMVMSTFSQLEQHIASTALALESLELLLIDKGVLVKDELMSRLTKLAQEKKEQVEAEERAKEFTNANQ